MARPYVAIDKLEVAFDGLRLLGADTFLDPSQLFPPTGRQMGEYGPIHENYLSLIAHRRLSEDEDEEGCIEAVQDTIDFAEAYKRLLISFATDYPVFVLPRDVELGPKLRKKVKGQKEKYEEGSEVDLGSQLQLHMIELLEFQSRYTNEIASARGIFTGKTTDWRPMRGFDYNFWDDVNTLKDFIRSAGRREEFDSRSADLVSAAYANSIRRQRPSVILSSTKKVMVYIEEVFKKFSLQNGIPFIFGEARTGLSGSSPVRAYHFGVRGDLLKDADTASTISESLDSHTPPKPRYKKPGNGNQAKQPTPSRRVYGPDPSYYGRGGFDEVVF